MPSLLPPCPVQRRVQRHVLPSRRCRGLRLPHCRSGHPLDRRLRCRTAHRLPAPGQQCLALRRSGAELRGWHHGGLHPLGADQQPGTVGCTSAGRQLEAADLAGCSTSPSAPPRPQVIVVQYEVEAVPASPSPSPSSSPAGNGIEVRRWGIAAPVPLWAWCQPSICRLLAFPPTSRSPHPCCAAPCLHLQQESRPGWRHRGRRGRLRAAGGRDLCRGQAHGRQGRSGGGAARLPRRVPAHLSLEPHVSHWALALPARPAHYAQQRGVAPVTVPTLFVLACCSKFRHMRPHCDIPSCTANALIRASVAP